MRPALPLARRLARPFALALSAALLFACGARSGGGTFTTRGELAERPAQPLAPHRAIACSSSERARARTPPAPPQPIFTEAWALAGPFPDETTIGAPLTASSPLDRLALEAAAGSLRTSQAAQCAAREVARFQAERGRIDLRMTRFALARCGITAEALAAEGLVAELAAGESELDALRDGEARLRTAALAASRRFAGAGLDTVGFGAASARGRASFVLLGAREEVVLDAPLAAVTGDAAVLRGHLERPAEHVVAWVAFGPDDYAECDMSRRARLPRFGIRCPMHPSDRTAWIDVLAIPPGRVLGFRVGRILLRRDEGRDIPPLAFGPELTSASATALREAMLAQANELRARTGRAPLTLDVAQSATMESLTTEWIAAELEGRAADADVIALGMMAGWDVGGGTIRDAHISTAMDFATSSPAEWLALLFEQPMARFVLLDPGVSRAAIGTRWDPSARTFVGALATYAFFEGESADARRQRALRSVRAIRSAADRDPPSLFAAPELQRAAREIHTGNVTPGAALDRALGEAAQRLGRPMRGLLLETLDLNRLELPSELLQPQRLTIALEVSWYRAPGAAWGQYVVLILAVD